MNTLLSLLASGSAGVAGGILAWHVVGRFLR
jgi:hypothetical protein